MRRLTSRRQLPGELPPLETWVATRNGELGRVIAHEDGQARLQFQGHIQGLYASDEMTWVEQVPARESKWHTASAEEFHFAASDYPELEEILNAPRPVVVTEGNEWGRTASRKTGTRHLTLTGPYAGTPICGATRQATDDNVHAAYAPEEMLTSPDTCAACRAIWATGDPDADPSTAPDASQQSLFATKKLIADKMIDKVFGDEGHAPEVGSSITMDDGHVWTVTNVNDHTVGLSSDDGWTTSLQRPWLDREGKPLPGAPQDQHDIYNERSASMVKLCSSCGQHRTHQDHNGLIRCVGCNRVLSGPEPKSTRSWA